MRKDFLVFGSPLIEQPEIDEVVATLKSGWIGTGPKTHKFEDAFKAHTGTKHAIALSSCTAALHLALRAIGVSEGDEIIVPSMTFAATANTVVHCGARPVFADCDRETQNILPEDIERRITQKTKAIVVVHMAGRPCEMDEILKIAKRHDLKVIEDAAHAIETEYKGRKAGTIGDIGCFSFYVTKNLVTAEGGMATTENDAYAQNMRVLSLHGLSADAWKRYGEEGYKHYDVVEAGYKYNMTDLQASLGFHQLARIEVHRERREELWQRYMRELAGLPLILPAPIREHERHAYHLFTVIIDTKKAGITRDEFLDGMTKRNIGTGVHFRALHLQPYYRKLLGHKEGDLPNAEWIGDRTVSIPFSAKLTDDDVSDVIHAIKDIFTHAKQ
ncbi:DegT/DnrJ/EryC1/StrS family aminotransferase [Candidatus Kaiserbacteria bacterium]|nr:DegT/DnrJ/EryC1/StrS family aminotransferase [Candidatus Kaiserbacteria bacterium]